MATCGHDNRYVCVKIILNCFEIDLCYKTYLEWIPEISLFLPPVLLIISLWVNEVHIGPTDALDPLVTKLSPNMILTP